MDFRCFYFPLFCIHWLMGSNHTLIGYAGGLAAKQGMLALEADSCDGPSGSRIGQLF